MMAADDDDFEAREERVRKHLLERAEEAIALRSKDREFHGIERELRYHQSQMLVDYNKSKDVKHPRDLGDVREQILRRFLTESGLLPARYAVSDRSTRIASKSGHLSKEIDIALYDYLDSVSLMNREDSYQVLPLESVYGVIQVKSKLGRAEIRDGLANLASFKSLKRQEEAGQLIRMSDGLPQSHRGFGLLFAYDSELKWTDIIAEVEAFAKNNPKQNWANAIFVLSRGFFFHGVEGKSSCRNEFIDSIDTLQMHGFPDRDATCLYSFLSILLSLLRGTSVQPASIDDYFRLPLVAEGHSYRFHLGAFAEVGKCAEHGVFQRKIAADKLEKVINWCRTSDPINWVRAMHLAYGNPEDEEAYRRQPGDVYIYNPRTLPLKDILVQEPTQLGEHTVRYLSYDLIESAGMHIIIPGYYSVIEDIVSDCPKCPKFVAPADGQVH